MKFNWKLIDENTSLETSDFSIYIDDRNFKPYYCIKKILDHKEIFSENSSKLLDKLIYNEQKNIKLKSENVLYAVIRRISRESISSLDIIDKLSRNIAEKINKLDKSVTVNIFKAEYIDRISARIITNVINLANKNIEMNWYFSCNPFINCDTELKIIRKIFLKNIVYSSNVLLTNEFKSSYYSNDLKVKCNTIFSDDYEMEAAHSLITMNYDRAMLIADLIHDKIQSKRIKALVYCNIGMYSDAKELFLEIIDKTTDDELKVHINYLLGLLYLKRFYDIPKARETFEKSKSILSKIPSSKNKTIETAWLLNGISFLEVFDKENSNNFPIIFKREMEAYEMIKNTSGKGESYLKYNLFSNMVFLLEINNLYKEAYKLWKEVFEKHSIIIEEDDKVTYDAPYLYRYASIKLKENVNSENLKLLKDCLNNLLDRNSLLLSIFPAYALTYFYYKSNNISSTLYYANVTLEISIETGDKDFIYRTLEILKKIDNVKYQEFLTKINKTDKNFLENLQIENFISNDVYIPKTKLPSYIPRIDLESVPMKDMNHYLLVKE